MHSSFATRCHSDALQSGVSVYYTPYAGLLSNRVASKMLTDHADMQKYNNTTEDRRHALLTEGRSVGWYKPCGSAVACVRRPLYERMAQVDGSLYLGAANQLIATDLRSLLSSLGRGKLGDGLRALQRQHVVYSDALPGPLP